MQKAWRDGTSRFRGVNAPQSLQAAEANVHIYKRWFYTIDGRIRIWDSRVLALMVWGPLLPSPNSSNSGQGWWTQGEGSQLDVNVGDNNVQFRQGAKCPKPSFIAILGQFHHGYALFLSDNVKYRFQTRFGDCCAVS